MNELTHQKYTASIELATDRTVWGNNLSATRKLQVESATRRPEKYYSS
ncbi:hypothetical protein GGP87_000327 [Salinibacter ruber]|nr:hypothetical protein [Salinibacter ruber]